MTSKPEETTTIGTEDLLRRERDWYRSLLELGTREAIEPFLEDALRVVVEMSGAVRGYLEVAEPGRDDGARFSIASGIPGIEVDSIRASLSRGVMGEALATGRTIAIDSAQGDLRFVGRHSVMQNRIESVLCAPIGTPPMGVLYLQDRQRGGAFGEEDRARVEMFAAHVAVFADRLLARRWRRGDADPTQAARAKLQAAGIIGKSRALASALDELALVAPLNVAVLFTGPSGTGKTQLARVLHDSSPRKGGPFVELNCASLPETLVESELFGAMPGAHSTARKKLIGKVGAAEGGTLLLDEIGELPLASQAKLLQLLQSKEYRPLGATNIVRANVRVVAATNVDLKAAVAAKTFREDLYYRLAVLMVAAPALADRREDLAELAAELARRALAQHGLPTLTLSPAALRGIEAAEWPGNVRQLAHAVEVAAIRAAGAGARAIEPRHLFPDASDASIAAPSFQEATRRFQSELLRRTLEETDWNVVEAAERLDLARSHVYNLIKAFGLAKSAS